MLGDLYHRDDRSFMGQLWEMFTTCEFVEPDAQRPGTLKWEKKVQKTKKMA